MKKILKQSMLKGMFLCLSFAFSSYAMAQMNFNKDSLDAKLKSWLPAINEKTPGYVLGVVSKGKVIYTNNKGSADLETGIQINENTIFNIGSVSKQFTAFLILQLEQEGKLGIEERASNYLPEYPVLTKFPIKISHLLHHTSGLREILELLEVSDGQNKFGYTMQNLEHVLLRQKDLNFTPGQMFQYINTNYFFLGKIIEKITGKAYPEYCREKIFTPLAMNTAFVMDHFKKLVPLKAKAYIKNGDNFENAMPLDEFYGANGIHASIHDLMKWAANLTNRQVGNDALFTKFTLQGKLDKGQDLSYGYGLMFENYKGLPIINHNGSRLGYRAEILYLPTEGLAIVALANFRSFPVVDIPKRIAEYILNLKQPVSNPGVQTRFNSLIKEGKQQIDHLTGVYWNPDADLVRKIYIKDGVLTYFRTQGNESAMVSGADTIFYMKLGDSLTNNRLYFPSQKKSNGAMVFIGSAGDSAFYKKMDTVSSVGLTEYAGSFYCDEIDASLHLTVKEDQLMLTIKGWPEMKLLMRFKDYFDNNGIGSFYFKRDQKGKIKEVLYNSPRTRHLKYIKIL